MDTQLPKTRLGSLIDRFGKSPKGSVAMMTGLVFTVLFAAAGGAVDYSRTITVKQKAQRAMDATVLSLARREVPEADLQAEGEQTYNGFLAQENLNGEVVELTFSPNEDGIRGTAVVTANTYFLGIIGLDAFDSTIKAEAIPPKSEPIEIALVLDASGSMAFDLNGQSRMERMKSAVNTMLETLDDTLPKSTDLSVALVPYSTSVNLKGFSKVLKSNSAKNNLPKPANQSDVWAAERFSSEDGATYRLNNKGPSNRRIPFVLSEENGAAAPFVGITPLTSDQTQISQAMESLSPAGWTAGHLGMSWGVYALSSEWGDVWPTAPGPKGEAKKILVFLSDGEFNTTHNIGAKNSQDSATSYAYFQSACDMASSEGIVVYTIALNLDEASASALRECVSNGGQFYTPDSASGLAKAFEDIALSVGQLRLSS